MVAFVDGRPVTTEEIQATPIVKIKLEVLFNGPGGVVTVTASDLSKKIDISIEDVFFLLAKSPDEAYRLFGQIVLATLETGLEVAVRNYRATKEGGKN